MEQARIRACTPNDIDGCSGPYRATEYARGARDGAPAALQVADRWHVLVRRVTHYAIPVANGRGSEGNLWVNG